MKFHARVCSNFSSRRKPNAGEKKEKEAVMALLSHIVV
jgi:hypothetical protein